MRDAVIVEAVRTPIGKRNGSLAAWHAADLSATVLRAVAQRSGVAPDLVDDVIWGCVRQSGHQANNVGRNAVLAAGWPESVPATTIDRQCGSSQQAVHFAAAGLIAGQYDVVVAGGVEIMSSVPAGAAIAVPEFGHPTSESIKARYGVDFNQGVGAEQIAEKWGLSR
ncbi:MAG: beta-ketoacyl synthase N-terminal-like domain-containing protein, partial [Mycetocola sp.]